MSETSVIADAPAAALGTPEKESASLPKGLLTFFYWFPLIIYIPDMWFSYHIYTTGAGVPGSLTADNWLLVLPQVILWGAVAAGTVGMSYLFSILAPYHWVRGNRAASLACWLGVLIATLVTVVFSLAFRSEEHAHYAFDATLIAWWPALGQLALSPIQAIAAFAPPFWGLFWAVVQPARQQVQPSAAYTTQNADAQIAAIQANAKIKAAQAEAAASIRKARLGGLAKTMRDAREQVRSGGEDTPPEPIAEPPALATYDAPQEAEAIARQAVVPVANDAAPKPRTERVKVQPRALAATIAGQRGTAIERGRAEHVTTSADALTS